MDRIRCRRYPCTLQHDASDCAAAVISTVLLCYKKEMTLMKIREFIQTDAYGTSVKGMIEGLEKLGFRTKALRVEVPSLEKKITLPVIAQVIGAEKLSHFVVVHKIKRNTYILADPARGIVRMSEEDFIAMFTGVMIFLVPTSSFEQQKNKKQGMFSLFKQLLLPHKTLLLTILAASLLLSIIGMLFGTFSKILMDEIIPFQLKNTLYIFIIAFGMIAFFQNLLSAFRQQIILFLSRKVDIPLFMGYYDHILHLPHSFFASRRVGDIITRFQDAITIKDVFTSISISLVMDVLLAFIATFILWKLNASLFVVLLVMVMIDIVLVYLFKKPYKELNYEQMEAGAHLNSHLIESIQNIETIKALRDEPQQMDTLETRFMRILKLQYREGTLKNVQGVISQFFTTLGSLIFMAVGALFIIDKQMTIGDLLVFQTLSVYFTEPVQNLVAFQITFQEADIAMKRLSELMSLQREDISEELQTNDISFMGKIQFRDVSFAYGSRPPIIQDFNLTIPYGETIAFVGESGAGKTTLMKLLVKFIFKQTGKITISNYDMDDISMDQLRQKISYLPQQVKIFTGSILDNLKVGNPLATYEEILHACRLAGANEFIDRLPHRYQTHLEEGGENLSGGEKQRIAIARTLVKKSDVYIFDESTSHLDSFSERKIHSLIFDTLATHTILIVAHRISTILDADRICFLEQGKIVESGSHEELVQLNGRYAKMIYLQMGKAEKRVGKEEVTYE